MSEQTETAPLQAAGGARADTMSAEPRWPVQWTNRIQKLAAILGAVVDPASMAREAVEHGNAALDADAGVVFLLSADGAALEIANATGYPKESVGPWLRFPLTVSLPATDAIRDCQPVLVHSHEEMRQRYPALAATPGTLSHHSWAAMPLVVDGVCIGVLGFSFLVGRAFETQEVAFMRVVADQCAQALHRAQLAERERRSTARLRVLAEASRLLAAASPDVTSVVNALAAEVIAHVGQACSISLATSDGELLEPAAIYDQDPERQARQRELSGQIRLRRGEGASGRVLATGHALLIPIVGATEFADPSFARVAQALQELGVRSLLAVPINISGRTLGTIAASRYVSSNPFTDDDRALLEDLADRAALAIENARLHEAERQARARAEEADRRKDEFIAMLGHELRNPLAPISTAIEIMRQLPDEGERLVWAREAIARQVTQLSRLVDDLLDVSRINLGKIELRLEPLDIGAIALQALEASRPLLTERNHQVAVEMPGAPARVQGDAIRLTQAISNLLNNAAKYTDPCGRIRLSVGCEGEEVIVTVSDSGIGIPADMLARVFEPFAQGREARNRSKGGLGIGLTLVKRLVELHGGSVRVSSAGEGHGSEFAIGLPRLAPASAVAGAGAPAARARVAARRVLIADDNVDAAEGLRRLLELQSHQVEVVHDGTAAVEVLSRSEPEVVLLDISLPGLDGLEVARRVRARGGARRPLLVAITGLGRNEDRQRSADAGFDHHLVKPIDLSSLAALLERVARRDDSDPLTA
jgi:signal transduction histidine kinase/ActR/RegA family two-component response regulator